MNFKDEQIRAAIAEQAADWFVMNDEGPLDEQESAALIAWLKASPANVEEFLGVSVIARDLREACAEPEHSVDILLARVRAEDDSPVEPRWSRAWKAVRDARAGRWQTAAVAMAAIGVVSLGLLLLWNLRPVARVPAPAEVTVLHFETRHGEQQTHRLEDNSVLRLNTDSAVTIRYSKTERRVTLTSGEADFEVVHEPDRPFRVFAGPAEVVDLGTRFDVRLEDRSTLVTVVEGRVAVGRSPSLQTSGTNSNPDHPPVFVQLKADEQLRVTPDQWPATPVTTDPQRTTAWLHRQIMFEREPLERVASEFNRYAAKPIEITAPELRSLEISGVFATDDAEAFIAFLRSLEGVRVDVTATRILVSHK
jgi:transmembrane sensor